MLKSLYGLKKNFFFVKVLIWTSTYNFKETANKSIIKIGSREPVVA